MDVHIRPGQIWTCSYPAWLDLVLSISGRPGRIWSGPDLARPDMDVNIRPGLIWTCPYPAKLSQLAGGAGKKHLFWRVFVGFSSCFLLFHRQFVYDTDILKKKIGPSLLFLAAGTTDTKFRRSTGVATANSTNKYQKYK